MQQQITLNGKILQVTLSRAAEHALAERDLPLQAEMELYFSCLIRKQVRFHDKPAGEDAVPLNDSLNVRFHPVMSQGCSIDENGNGPPLTDFPIVGAERFSPQWLIIDYRDGHWQGEFGY
jgi:hypothetical protein